jgi:aminoglycoside phosphotransferase (APT) family kinase protein
VSLADDTFEKFAQVARALDPGAALIRAWELKGGVSAQVTALEVRRRDGALQRMVVRRHGPADLRHNPRIAADEYRLLRLVRARGVAAPAAYYVDESGTIFDTPYVVIEFVDGATEFGPANLADMLAQLAAHLASIHCLDGSHADLAFLPSKTGWYANKLRSRPELLDDSIDEGRIRDRLEPAWPLPQRNPSALLHGDYWPGNILWRDGRLAAVLDWEDAAVGDPLADLGNTRLELLWAFGAAAMERFTAAYRARMPLDYAQLPYWDLCAALRPAFKLAEWAAGDARAEQAMRAGHRAFITQAFEALG